MKLEHRHDTDADILTLIKNWKKREEEDVIHYFVCASHAITQKIYSHEKVIEHNDFISSTTHASIHKEKVNWTFLEENVVNTRWRKNLRSWELGAKISGDQCSDFQLLHSSSIFEYNVNFTVRIPNPNPNFPPILFVFYYWAIQFRDFLFLVAVFFIFFCKLVLYVQIFWSLKLKSAEKREFFLHIFLQILAFRD
jgi:hypothetical protein